MTELSWDGVTHSPDTKWASLSADQQSAAANLCYESWSWDGAEIPGGGGGGGLACVSGANDVQVRGKGLVTVDQLSIGDYVMASNGKFSRIYSFSHFDPDILAEYLQIYVSGLSQPLEISGEHMLLVNNRMVRANQVDEGDMLGDRLVEKIGSVHRKGAYAPVTESGDVVVAGVLASSFVAILDHSPINQHFIVHAFLSPLRLMCSLDFGVCENETYTDGYSNWIYLMMKVAQAVNAKCGPVLQTVASLLALAIFTLVYVLVEVLMSPPLLSVACFGTVVYWSRKWSGRTKAPA